MDSTWTHYRFRKPGPPIFVLSTFLERDSLLNNFSNNTYYRAMDESLYKYQGIERRLAALNDIIRKIDSDDDVITFWDGNVGLDTLYLKSVFPATSKKFQKQIVS